MNNVNRRIISNRQRELKTTNPQNSRARTFNLPKNMKDELRKLNEIREQSRDRDRAPQFGAPPAFKQTLAPHLHKRENMLVTREENKQSSGQASVEEEKMEDFINENKSGSKGADMMGVDFLE